MQTSSKTARATCFLEQQFIKPAAMALVVFSLGTVAWISSNHLRKVAIASGIPTKTILGISVVNPSELVARTFMFPRGRGVLITQVINDSVGATAGLVKGDGITVMNGKPVNSPEDLAAVARSLRKGDLLEMTIIRGGLAHELAVLLQPVARP